MFWIGFFSIPLILLMLFGLMAGSGKLLNKTKGQEMITSMI